MVDYGLIFVVGIGVGFAIRRMVRKWVHRPPPMPSSFDQREEEIWHLERMYYGEKREGEGDEE